MPDFSPSGIYGLPALTTDSLKNGGDPRVLGWLQEAIQEGDLINRYDPSFEAAEKGMRYIVGDQPPPPSQAQAQYIPYMVINKSRKSTQAHVSALTDIKPVFGYKATNPKFNFHADLLNKLTIATWITNMMDVTLGDAIKYGLAGGTADLAVEWDPGAAFSLGDHKIIAKDFRDTLPIRPGTDPSPQLWQGVIFREAHTVNAMRQKYPSYAGAFRPAQDNLITTVMSRFRRVATRLISPMATPDTLSGLAGIPAARPVRPGDIVLYRTYLADASKNMTSRPIVMGDPNANWSYIVEPGELMYPQKRLIVSTPDLILYDGPNTYWHGMYPFGRLKLWSVPWQFLGLPLLNDTIPIQDAINDVMKDLRLGLKQWTNPDTLFDRTAGSRAFRVAFDPQKPGKKIEMGPLSQGGPNREPYKKLEGPAPHALTQLFTLFEKLEAVHDDMTGVANLQQLMQLRQMPSGDTIQKYYEALTPEIRAEGRAVESFLRDVAEMHKFNIFQFQNQWRRVAILGDAAQALEDFDYDPETLVPSMDKYIQEPDPLTGMPVQKPNPDYVASLDRSLSRSQRAKAFAKMFVFTIAPNSILAMNTQEKKMMAFQETRMGYMDFWTFHEIMETPNVGNPPPMPLPPLQPPDPALVQQELMAAMQAQAQGMPPQPTKYTIGPTGEILEIRTPMTITERLQAQQMMGIGMTENPAGRKASGQQAPQMEEKEGGERQTVTESPK